MPGGGTDRVPDKNISNIFEQNEAWVRANLDKDGKYFDNLGSGHKPDYLWIGCSDARVPANEIMGEDAGSVFQVRNVANMVIGTDFNLMSALQYAVAVLKIPHIIVCGHYDCGGVRASIENRDHVPPLENWLRNIRDVYRLHRTELDAIVDPEDRHRRLVELNVVEQCINIFKTGAVQRSRVESYQDPDSEFTTPRIHACVFDPKTGRLRRLDVDFRSYINDLHDIYDLYQPEREDGEKLPTYVSKKLLDAELPSNAPEAIVETDLLPPKRIVETATSEKVITDVETEPIAVFSETSPGDTGEKIKDKTNSKNLLKRAWKKVFL